jgi:hypothetical protein
MDLDTFTAVADGAGNPAVANGAGLITIQWLAGVAVISRQTFDADGDGRIDRIRILAGEALDDDFSGITVTVAGYTVTGYTTGTPGDAEFFVLVTPKTSPDTGATPAVQITTNTSLADSATGVKLVIRDTAAVTTTDGCAPRILYTLAVAAQSRIYIRFSEPVYGSGVVGTPIATADFAYSKAGVLVSSVTALLPSGAAAGAAFVDLDTPIAAEDFVTLTPETLDVQATVVDAAGIPVPIATRSHRVSDLGLDVMSPVWATSTDPATGAVSPMLSDFDGGGFLPFGDITLQGRIEATNVPAAVTGFHYDVDVPSSVSRAGAWIPAAVANLVPDFFPAVNTEARSLAEVAAAGQLRDFFIDTASDAELALGATLQFLFDVDGLYCATVTDPTDPRTVNLYQIDLQPIIEQRAGVTILNNVINPDAGEVTTLRYRLESRGMVTVTVFTLDGTIVDVLHRGSQPGGDYSLTWDGHNRGGRAVARGVYFIKVVGPGFQEIRKVLVVR